MNDRTKLRCPGCGAEMNRHAEKIDTGRGSEEGAAGETDLGGILVEFHTCPVCGFVVERLAV